MLKQTTIDQVNDLPLDQVIGKYVELKKAGSVLKGMSPFTEENSPSFIVSPSKGIWKCFSTGKGGNSSIKFVMEKEMCSYPEAITRIADANGVLIEYDDGESGKKYLEKANRMREVNDVCMMAMEYFESNIDKTPADIRKRIVQGIEEKFGIGYALNQWDGLTKHLVSEGISYDMLEKAGVTVKGPKGYYDFFRGRVMFPIFSKNGKIIGFSGRDAIYATDQERKENNCPKTLNSKDSDVFSKSNNLLGLFQSKSEISRLGFAVIVEGNHDMTSMHEVGMTNTVASLGTAFTEEHVKLLKNYTDTIVFFSDNDKAGKSKIKTNVELVLKNGMKAFILLPEQGEDPDDFAKRNAEQDVPALIEEMKLDGVDWLAQSFFENAETAIKKGEAEQKLVKLLSIVQNAFLRNAYVKDYSKKYGISKSEVEKAISLEIATKAKEKDVNEPKGHQPPAHINQESQNDWKEFGFYHETTREQIGYHFPSQGKSFERISNFIITPLFQIRNGEKRIVEIQNKYGKEIIEVPDKAFVGPQQFEEIVINRGKFWFDGTKKQFQYLRRKLLDQFRTAIEIRTLGWQRDGFFAFADGIVDGSFKKVDSNGLCNHNETDYFLPAFSKIYQDVQEEDDNYKSDRYFIYRPSKISIREWSEMMVRVHGDNGEWATLYLIAALFRDFIFQCLDYFPWLFGFGQVQTGKSTCARSINTIFYGNQAPFNLSSGTNVSFYRRLARTRNTIIWFDEYSNDIDKNRIQALKAGFDGAGHEKGTLSRDYKTETTPVNSGGFITGQYLPTVDDNALFTRCIMLYFEVKAEDRSKEDMQEYFRLKEHEKRGLSNLIIEVVKYRDYFESEFESEFQDINASLKATLQGEDYKGRILDIYSIVLCCHKLLGDKLALPFNYDEMYQKAIKQILKQSEQVNDSDALRSYWKMMEFMSMQHMIKNDEDYKVVLEQSVTVREGRAGNKTITFPTPTKVLYIRLTKVHPLYMETHRKQMGENGVPEQSIKSYMKSSKSFIGNVGSTNFDGTKTSAFAFYFDDLGITLKGVSEWKKEDEPQEMPF